MNAERLLAHYEAIADAPEAIARLRRFILDLAVRGKLVPQDANDEPASELLKRIAKEKARLVNAGEIARLVDVKPAGQDDLSFDIPAHWQPVKIEQVLNELQTGPFGSSLHQSDYRAGGTPVINPASIQNEQIVPIDKMAVDALTLERLASFKLRWGDIVMARRGEMGRCAIVQERETGWLCGTGSLILRPSKLVYANFLVLLIGSPFGRVYLGGSAVGTTMQNLNQTILLNFPFGLPPLAEQRRIVAKVDELMELCDRLEAARACREATRDRLTAASLARLNAPGSETFYADARFALDALPALTTRPDQIKALRQTILNLAVRGKLVPQDPNDEPASELLKQIAKERAELVRRKEIRREDPLDPIRRPEMPFDVPASWIWSRIGDTVLFTQYGTSQKSNPSEQGVPVLTMGNIQDGLVVWSNEKRIPETSEDLPALYLRKFDLLYNRTNSAELVGKTGIYLGEDGTRTFASYLIRLRPSLLSSNPRFLNIAMNTPEFRKTQILPHIKKQTGQANVNGTALKNMLIPMPPLAEQHRIVAKVDELMTLCDRLEAGLTATAANRRRLLDALLAEALAPVDAREMEAAE